MPYVNLMTFMQSSLCQISMSVKFSKASVFMENAETPLGASDVVVTVGLLWIPMSKTAQVIRSVCEDINSESSSSVNNNNYSNE